MSHGGPNLRAGSTATHEALTGALVSFDRQRAQDVIQAAMLLRPVEQVVTELILPTLTGVAEREGVDSAPWAFAARWGTEWLRRAQRLAPAPTQAGLVVIGDAAGGDLDPDSLHVRALELFCMRSGMRVFSLSAEGVVGVGEAMLIEPPSVVVLAGEGVSEDTVSRWAYAVRLATGPLPVAVFRRAARRARIGSTDTILLPALAAEAQECLLDLLTDSSLWEREGLGEQGCGANAPWLGSGSRQA